MSSAPQQAPARNGRRPFSIAPLRAWLLGGSLVQRIAVVLILVVTLTTLVLFAGIDYFVTGQFSAIHDQYLVRRTGEIRQILDRESNLLLRSMGLAAADSDLIHSVHYHLNLRGEDKSMRDEVLRMAETFALADLEVWTADGRRLISRDGGGHLPVGAGLRRALAEQGQGVRMVWHRDDIWAVAVSRLSLTPQSHAVLVAGRPLGRLLSTSVDGEISLRRGELAGLVPDEMVQLVIDGGDDPATVVYVHAANPVRAALATTKLLIIAALAVGGILLLLVITVFLRFALRPVAGLTAAAEAFGQGRTPVLAEPQGPKELVTLVGAFRRMVADLQRLRSVEQKAHHDRQLASVGKLAAKLAHDINNPLTVIANVTRLLLRGEPEDAPRTQDLRTILKNCERCANIAGNLLRFSQPLRLKLHRSELGELCREAAGHSRQRLPQLAIEVRGPATPLYLSVDRFQFGRVLDNLINNAFQACPEKPVALEYGTAEGRAYVAVIDQGRGFAAEAIDHLFEPFFTTKPEGSGLGLASCLAIARAHGGDLRLTAPDRGQVTLWLPLLQPDTVD